MNIIQTHTILYIKPTIFGSHFSYYYKMLSTHTLANLPLVASIVLISIFM